MSRIRSVLFGVGAGALIGLLVIGVVALLAAIYNHEACSTTAQVLQGCSYVRPSAINRLIFWPAAIVGGIVAARTRRR